MMKPFQVKRRLLLHLRLAFGSGTLPIHGVRVRIPMRHAVDMYRQLVRQTYEADEVELVRSHVPPDRPVVELGASLGIVSTVVRSFLQPEVPMICVEAHPGLLATAEKNVAAYDPFGRTKFLHRAIDYHSETVRFSTGLNAHANSKITGDVPDAADGFAIVKAIRLGDIVHGMGGGRGLTLISDIEGAEWDVFEQDRDALQHFDTAVVETHPDRFSVHGVGNERFHVLARAAGLSICGQRQNVFAHKRDVRR